MKRRSFFFLAAVLLNTSYIFSEYSPNLPLNSTIDALMIRMASRYQIDLPASFFFQTIGYTHLVNFFLTASSKDSTVLSRNEKLLIANMMKSIDRKNGLLKWSSTSKDINLRVQLKLNGDLRFSVADSASVGMKGIIGPLFCGNIGDLSFYSGIDVWTEYRSDTLFPMCSYQPYDGIPYNLYGRNIASSSIRSSDLPRGGVKYDFGSIQIETALDYLKIGPAVFYPVTLSGLAPPITYFRGTIDLGIINYTHVAGLLRAKKDKNKYLYAHRLSADLWKSRLALGLNEIIITGDLFKEPNNDSNEIQSLDLFKRDWEWPYLIPFIPFKFVEHYVGDRDNAALSIDFNLLWPRNFRWYGEFFLDDILSPWTIFSNDWGNKWATSLGGQYFGSIKNHEISISAEYSHVEPWVYTHFYGGSHRYSHFNKCLGSPLGPNSQAFVLDSRMNLNEFHEVGISISSIAINRLARGGTITDIFQYPDPEDSTEFFDSVKKQFLGAGTTWSLKPSICWSFNPYGLFCVNARYEIDLLAKGLSNFYLWGGFTF